MQKARCHPNKSGLQPLVSVWFQVLFTLLLAVLFTFPSRYLFTIGLSGVFSLSRWCCHIHARFLRSRATLHPFSPPCTGLSPSLVYLSRQFYLTTLLRLGSSVFARHYLRNPFLSLFSYRYLDVSVPCVLASRRQIFNLSGFPIRTSADQHLFAIPRSFSQLNTSFVISESLGIPHTLLFASYFLLLLS